MSTSLLSGSHIFAECISRPERLLVLSRPPAFFGAESARDVPFIGDYWSKATFLRRLRDSILSTGKRREKAQERYKRDFDKKPQ